MLAKERDEVTHNRELSKFDFRISSGICESLSFGEETICRSRVIDWSWG